MATRRQLGQEFKLEAVRRGKELGVSKLQATLDWADNCKSWTSLAVLIAGCHPQL